MYQMRRMNIIGPNLSSMLLALASSHLAQTPKGLLSLYLPLLLLFIDYFATATPTTSGQGEARVIVADFVTRFECYKVGNRE